MSFDYESYFLIISFEGGKKVEISTAFRIFLGFKIYDSFLKWVRKSIIDPPKTAYP